ncbi:hypothetical protein [Teichococcus coralli]|nr:hypothetical protein [Pseudoroseomonas coralli]
MPLLRDWWHSAPERHRRTAAISERLIATRDEHRALAGAMPLPRRVG